MEKILKQTEEYIKKLNLSDLAIIKICTLAVGMLLGMAVPKKCKKMVVFITMIVFVITYIPAILKFLKETEIMKGK